MTALSQRYCHIRKWNNRPPLVNIHYPGSPARVAHGISTVEGKRLSGTSELFKERIMKTQLNASESAKLIELGVSPERASEIKVEVEEPSGGCPNIYCSDVKRPIFTLADILDILPKEIEDYHLSIESFKETHYTTYIRDNYDDYLIPHKDAPELIDALYSLLLWCLEKGYVK